MAEDFNNYLMEDEETSGFDYKAFFFKLLMYWPWIVGCVLVALIGAFFYLKTLTPLYTVNSSVLIKDDKGKTGSSEASLADLGFVTSSTQNFDNELEILRSRTLLKKVVTNLDLYISYNLPGRFRNEEVYKQSPVKVWVTPEEAERMGYAEVEMHFQNGKLHTATVLHKGEEWKKEIDSLPAVFSTPVGVFTFSAADSTWQQLEPAPEVIQVTVLSPNAAAASFRNRLAVTPATNRLPLPSFP